jgi:hypothetical protein
VDGSHFTTNRSGCQITTIDETTSVKVSLKCISCLTKSLFEIDGKFLLGMSFRRGGNGGANNE